MQRISNGLASKVLAASSAGFLLALAPGAASADMFGGGRSYVALTGGISFLDVETTGGADLDTDTGFGGAVALGWRYPEGFRFELQAAFEGADFDGGGITDGDISAIEAFVNGYYDFKDSGLWRNNVTPYIGVGLGGARVKVDAGPTDGDDYALGIQGLAGLSFALTDRSELSLGYRYLWLDEVEIDHTSLDTASHALSLTLRFGL
ncbi:MAG: porin family protein [Alphaproteobacteria bacterium]|nr:porin family protein [Alphaproteobacteria bacterium]